MEINFDFQKLGKIAPPPQRASEAAPDGILDTLGTGLQRGILNLKATANAGASVGAGVLGFDNAQEEFLQNYEELSRQAEEHPLSVERVEDVNSPATFVRYAAGLLGENIPNIASVFLTGGVGGVLGKAVVRNVISRKVKDKLETRARNWAIKNATETGVTAGTLSTSIPLGVGEVAGEQRSAGLEQNPGVSTGFGSLIGALDASPVGLAFKAAGFGKPFESAFVKRVLEQGVGRRAAAGLAAGSAAEGLTEGLQEIVALAARDVVDENFDVLGDEAISRIKNAVAGGIVIGGGIGAVAGAVHSTNPANEDIVVPETVQVLQTQEHKDFLDKRFEGSVVREGGLEVVEEDFANTDTVAVPGSDLTITQIPTQQINPNAPEGQQRSDGVIYSLQEGGEELARGPLFKLTQGPLKTLYRAEDGEFGPTFTTEVTPGGEEFVANLGQLAEFDATTTLALEVINEAELKGYITTSEATQLQVRKKPFASLVKLLRKKGFDGLTQNGVVVPFNVANVQGISHNLFTIPTDTATDFLSAIQAEVAISAELQDRSDANELRRTGANLDTYNGVIKNFFSLLQFGKKNGHIESLGRYIDAIFRGQAIRMQWIGKADRVDVEMKNLGKARLKPWADFMFERNEISGRKRRKLTDAETLALVAKHQLDDDSTSLVESVDEYNAEVLRSYRDLALSAAEKNTSLTPAKRVGLMQDINADFTKLADRNFFTQPRFGRYFIRVKSRSVQKIAGQVVERGDTITWEQFPTKHERDRAFQQMEKDFRGDDVGINRGLLTDAEISLIGIPRSFISGLEEKLDLTESQRKHLQEVLIATAPERSFVKKFKKKKGVAGFSRDAQRGFVDYAVRSANHLARMSVNTDANAAIDDIRNSISVIDELQGGDSTKRREILEHVLRHKSDFQNPSTDFKALQAGVFTWYLGFNVKSALVNLTQVPFITFPAMAARWNVEMGRGGRIRDLQFANLDPRGDVAATRHLARAYKQAAQYWRNPTKLNEGLQRMLQRGQADGWLAQTLGSDLISQQTGENLSRTLASPGIGKFTQRASHYSAFLFQTAEKLNRKVTAIAGYNMALELGKSHEEAIGFAREMTLDTQFEFSKINKAELLRGRAGIFFVFWQHMLSTLHFVGNNPGAPRFMMMLLLVAGLQGLPFADNIFDLLDFAGTKMKTALGFKNPLVDLRGDLREFSTEIGLNPDLAMHGISRSGMGLPQIADMFGNPFPSFALDGSLSYGRPVPGTQLLNSHGGTFGSKFQQLATGAGGAALSVPIGIAQAIGDKNPDTVKRVERALPSALKSISKAYRLARDGGAVNNSGAVLPGTGFDITNPVDLAEIAMQATGLNSTRVASSNEREYHIRQVSAFYKAKQSVLLKQMGYARKIEDREGVADVRRAIKRFNDNLDGLFKVFRITPRMVADSVRAQLRAKRKTERGAIGKRSEQRLVEELRAKF